MDPKDGCEAICKIVMPEPQESKIDGKKRATWLLGKSWLFGKDYTVNTFIKWHQSKVVTIVQALVRYYAYVPILKAASFAKAAIVNKWKMILKLRKLGTILSEILRGQAMMRAIDDAKIYHELRDKRRAVLKDKETKYQNAKIVQQAWRPYNLWNRWSNTGYKLGRIELVRNSTICLQKAWRSYTVYPTYVSVWKDVVHKRSRSYLDALALAQVEKVKEKLAGNIMASKMKVTILKIRRRIRVQSHVRRVNSMADFVELKRLAAILRCRIRVQSHVRRVNCMADFVELKKQA